MLSFPLALEGKLLHFPSQSSWWKEVGWGVAWAEGTAQLQKPGRTCLAPAWDRSWVLKYGVLAGILDAAQGQQGSLMLVTSVRVRA